MSQYNQPGGLFTSRRVGPPFGAFVRERLLQGRTDAAVTARVLDPSADSIYVRTPEGTFEPEDMKRRLLNFLLPIAFGFVLAVGIFSAGSYLLQGLGEEKESRILESILALVTPDELLAGKLFGLGSASLVLVLVWTALGAAGMVSQAPNFQVPAVALVAAPLYFLIGYFFFGSFMLGIGSLVSSFQEANQFAAMISFTAMLPFFVVGAIVDQPNGPLAVTLSLFPWTAPTAMMMRLPSGGVPLWQVALSLVLLLAAMFFMLRFSARIFRIGLLMYGKTPSLPEILRWARSE
jgi:ABC-2 type transport system permease protein